MTPAGLVILRKKDLPLLSSYCEIDRLHAKVFSKCR